MNEFSGLRRELKKNAPYTSMIANGFPEATTKRLLYSSGDVNPRQSTVKALVEAGYVKTVLPLTPTELISIYSRLDFKKLVAAGNGRFSMKLLNDIVTKPTTDLLWSRVVAICEAAKTAQG